MGFRASTPFTSSWEHFDLSVEDRVATLRFTRPDRLGALTFEVYADLRDLLGELEHRDDVDVLVITGEGRGFCSGGDVHEIIGRLVEMDARQLWDFTHMTGAVVQRLRELPMPVIAGVNGIAAGAGAVVALACDFRVCARSASLRFLFTGVGLSGADMGVAYLLPRIVGFGRATEILMLGDAVPAEAAVGMGLATSVVGDDELPAAVAALARRLADGPTLALRATKAMLTRELDMPLGPAIESEALVQSFLMTGQDFHEFSRAFGEKRPPRWTGR